MKSFFRTTTRVCGPERIFEELEPRIVLDASIDASGHDHSLGNHDLHGLFTQAVMDDGSADHHAAAMTADGSDQDFNVVLISNALPELDMLTKAASEHAQVVIFDSAKDNLDTINVRLHDMVESSGTQDRSSRGPGSCQGRSMEDRNGQVRPVQPSVPTIVF